MHHSPYKIRNIRLFIAFRVFFNSRFYYPIFTVLFLDFGLTLEDFALLNAVWAASIVVLEVPSGALADVIGRKNLLVFSSIAMIVEMALICMAPIGKHDTLFWIFLANRILSGAAEAAASGADEAIAYDALAREGNIDDWGDILSFGMRIRSAISIVAMSIGAFVYDHQMMQSVVDYLGWPVNLTREMTLKFPVYLTLGMAVLSLGATSRMQEIPMVSDGEDPSDSIKSLKEAFRLTFAAGGWILKTPFAFIVILFGMFFDHIMRLLITLNSQYFRTIQLPEALFGLVTSGMSLMGLFIPAIANRLVSSLSPARNMWILSSIAFLTIMGLILFIPYYGVVFALMIYVVLIFVNFFSSYYLNQVAESGKRATILSFRGLSFNLAYGGVGILYSMVIAALRNDYMAVTPSISDKGLENLVFRHSLSYIPYYFLIVFAVCLVITYIKKK